jgi:hypothetical protein
MPVVNTEDELNAHPHLDQETVNLILNAGTRVIYCVLDGSTLHLLMREAIKFKFAPYYGYQWTGTKAGIFSFPLSNGVSHCRANVRNTAVSEV